MLSLQDFYESVFFKVLQETCNDFDVPFDSSTEQMLSGSSPSYLINGGDWDTYFVANLLKKVENVDFGLDPLTVAKDEFVEFVLKQNDRQLFWEEYFKNLETGTMFEILKHSRAFISKALKSFKVWKLRMRHSNGATATCSRTARLLPNGDIVGGASLIDKTKDIDGLAYLYFHAQSDMDLRSILSLYPHREVQPQLSVLKIKLDAVWKTAKVGRVIGPGPTHVVALQNAIGDYLANVPLKRFCHIDMATAQEVHKSLVQEYSLLGGYSTLDLKGGSNNIHLALFDYLFSSNRDFANLVKLVCPRVIEFDNKEYNISMLALQGNGLIMALQTLVYYSIIHGVQKYLNQDHPIYVFGDDIICSDHVSEHVTKVFNFLDLTINTDKSFYKPPFLESCGMDSLYGNNVRPLYVKHIPTTVDEWIRLVNGIRRVNYYNNASSWRSDFTHNLWKRCVRSITKSKRIYAPRIYGDAAINIESTFLYAFAKPKHGDSEFERFRSGTKYPNGGVCPTTGRTFSSEYIKIRTQRQDYRHCFGSKVVGLPADVAFKLVSDPSLKGSGLAFRKYKGEVEYSYPKVFSSVGERTESIYVPYTPWGRAPEDIEELFDSLKESGNEIITDTDHIIKVYEHRLSDQRIKMMRTLAAYAAKREAVRLEALNTTFEL